MDDESPIDESVGLEPTEDPGGEEAEAPLAQKTVDVDGTDNLATVLSKDFLDKLAARVVDAYDQARKSSEGWREKVADYLNLYNGDTPDATGSGQENIVPMHLPYGKRAVRTYHSKIYPQLYPATGDLVNLKCRSPELQKLADRCTVHMNFQLSNQILEYLPSHDRAIKQLLIEGTFFETFYYDVLEQRPCQDIYLAEDFSIPYTSKTNRPDMADVPYKTLTKRFAVHQLAELEAAGDYFIGITKEFNHPGGGVTAAILPDPYDESGSPKAAAEDEPEENPVKETSDESSGVEKPKDDADGLRRFFEQDRIVKLPGQEKGRMMTVVLDVATTTIVRVAKCEIEDPQDTARYNREMIAWQQAVQSAQMAFSQAQSDHSAMLDAHLGAADPALAPHPGEPPGPPQLPPQPAPPKRVPWHRHTKYDCDMNPEGALGEGIMKDIYGHNLLANKVATRAVSQLTLACLPTFIASRQAKWSRNDQQLKLGKINESPLSPQQVVDGAGLKQVTFPAPDPNWYKAVQLADESCQEITAFNIASGGGGLSGQTATESELQHSNATDNIGAIGRRINAARAASLRNLAYVNSETLPDEGVTVYRDGQPIVVTRDDYKMILSELEVTFTCDPSFESKPLKAKRAQALSQSVTQIANQPAGPAGPVVDFTTCIQLNRLAAINYLEAIDAPAEMIQLIQNSPMPAPPFAGQPPGPGGPPPAGGNNGANGQRPNMEQGTGGGAPPQPAGGASPPVS